MIQEVVPSVALPVFAFYLLVACNYVKEIYGCRLQHVLDRSIVAKHIVAFLLVFFLVVIVNPDLADKRILQNILLSVGIYVWFLMTTRMPFWALVLVLVLLLASYIASIAKTRHEKDQNIDKIKTARAWQFGLAYSALAVSACGFVLYGIEKRLEYGRKFSVRKFFTGKLTCRGYTPSRARIWPALLKKFTR